MTETKTPTILIVGYTQSGKSTAARLLAEHWGCEWMGTSSAIMNYLDQYCSGWAGGVLIDLKNKTPGVVQRMLRTFLRDVGNFIREQDPAALVKRCLAHANIVEGVRTVEEFEASKHLFDHIVWIDRPGVERGITDELWESFVVKMVTNDGTEEQLLERLLAALKLKPKKRIPDDCPGMMGLAGFKNMEQEAAPGRD